MPPASPSDHIYAGMPNRTSWRGWMLDVKKCQERILGGMGFTHLEGKGSVEGF